jgi:hypothetical protein
MMSSQLKVGGAPILQLLMELFNCSLHTGEIPAGWRAGAIISLHKNGTCSDPSNYRGISILPAIYKLFASLIATRISATVPRHKHPYGVCGHKGTEGASFNFVMAILERLLNKERAYAFYLDIQKAFDTLNRDLLLMKLHHKVATGSLCHLVRLLYADVPLLPRHAL